jgi:fibronectin type 3 domain-containing protein
MQRQTRAPNEAQKYFKNFGPFPCGAEKPSVRSGPYMSIITRIAVLLGAALAFLTQVHAAPLLINAQQPNNLTRPQYIRDHFAHIESLTAFDGMVVRTDAGWNLMNGNALTYTQISNEFSPLVGLNFTRMKNNFAIVPVNRPADFFDNWSTTIENFRLLARVLREIGFVGIVLDTEEYMGHLWNYPDNCSYPSKTLAQYQAQANLVGKQVMQAMQSEFPGLQVIGYFGPCSSFSGAPPKAGGGNSGQLELMGPFEVGMIDSTQSQSLFVDGGEVYNLRGTGDFQDSYTYRKTTVALDSTNCPFIPSTLRPLWPQSVSVSFGVYNLGYEPMSPSIMRTTLENALRRCDRLVWLYFENLDWNTPGGISQDWVDAVNGAKAAVAGSTSPQPPAVSLSSPLNNSRFLTSANITIQASASDSDGSVTRVEFFSGSTKLGEDLSAPYTFSWVNPPAGDYVITAKATDNSGSATTSVPVAVNVSSAFSARINFQPATTSVPAGYLADSGATYGYRNNGLTYGWNANHTDETRDRGGNSDLRLATLIQMHAGGFWEIAVPSGSYNVTLGLGDGGFASTYTANVEGTNLCSAQALLAGQFITLSRSVLVSDGRLRIDQGTAGEEMTRVNYVLIDPVSAVSPPAAPTGLTIQSASGTSVNLAWLDNSSNETGFQLERSTASSFSPSSLVANLAAERTTYTDSGLTPATTYYYRIAAFNNAGSSVWATTSGMTQASSVLLPPQGVTAVPGDGLVTIAWTASTGATQYAVARSTTKGGPYSVVQSGAGTSEVDRGLTNRTLYYYVVTASNTNGQSGYSAEVSATPQGVISLPAAPTGLTAAPGDAKVSLSWSATAGASTYSVKRSATAGGPYATLMSGLTSTGFTDSGLVNGSTYSYVVSATNSAGEGPNSLEVSAKPIAPAVVGIPSAPENLAAKAGDKRVVLSWSSSASAQTYAVKRSTTNGGPYTLLSGAVTALSYTDTAVVNGTTYYYVLTARNLAGESLPSQQTGATPKVPSALPSAPTGLRATASAGKVSLAWNAVSGASGYHVKRALANTGPFVIVGSAVPQNSYVDTTAQSGATYFYAVTSLMESVNSLTASAVVTAPFSASVNFQPAAAPTPSGYVPDSGDLYGSRGAGLSYGWVTSHTDETRDRGGSTDPRLATLIQLHAGGKWQMAVPNGDYSVTVGIGDGGFASSYTLNVEGVAYWNNQALATGQFVNQTRIVTVKDNQLTLDPGAAPEEATRVNYVVIQGQ